MTIPFSVLDLAPIPQGSNAREALRRSLDLAQHAERWGYSRFWLAVMLGVNVVAADTDEEARLLFTSLQQAFVTLRLGPKERSVLDQTLACSVVGSSETVRQGLEEFMGETGADELMVTAQVFDHDARLRSFEITAEARDASAMVKPAVNF